MVENANRNLYLSIVSSLVQPSERTEEERPQGKCRFESDTIFFRIFYIPSYDLKEVHVMSLFYLLAAIGAVLVMVDNMTTDEKKAENESEK